MPAARAARLLARASSEAAPPVMVMLVRLLQPSNAIADLQGDVTVDITMVPSEGAVLSAEEIVAVDTEGAADVTSIGVSGESLQ